MTKKSKKKIPITLRKWHLLSDAKGVQADAGKRKRLQKKKETREERNSVGLQAWAESIGNLKAGQSLPF